MAPAPNHQPEIRYNATGICASGKRTYFRRSKLSSDLTEFGSIEIQTVSSFVIVYIIHGIIKWGEKRDRDTLYDELEPGVSIRDNGHFTLIFCARFVLHTYIIIYPPSQWTLCALSDILCFSCEPNSRIYRPFTRHSPLHTSIRELFIDHFSM